ncbi:MAG: hypothetical protein Q4A82_04270 [Corynebacterium sp.]|nr:hypothetical protein [Corynebacterium sp.]
MRSPITTTLAPALVSLLLLTGCSTLERFEPDRDKLADSEKIVEIAVRANSVEQVVLGELYKQGLERHGRPAAINMERLGVMYNIERLRQGRADIIIACGGRMLHHINAGKADELEKKYGAETKVDVNSGDQREEVYQAVMGALGDNVNGTDPSNALGCSDEDSAIPQHIIPIYRVPVLDRDERDALNVISGTLSTEELEELVEKSREGKNPSEVVSQFLDDHNVQFVNKTEEQDPLSNNTDD